MTTTTAAPPLDTEHAALLSKQVASWRAEIARLQDLIAHATGSTTAAQLLDLDSIEAKVRSGVALWRFELLDLIAQARAAQATDAMHHSSAATASEDARDAALRKINGIRNSIIGLQALNWSEHVYPLVAALDEAGYEGMNYPEARANYGTLLERAVKAEDELAAMRATQLESE
jgi:hypothetical protein